MYKKFIYLQWKSFFRAAGVASKLAQKILIGVVWAYFAFVFSGLAFIAFYGIQEEFGLDPLPTVSGFLIYAFALWIVIRYFIQKMPMVHVQPLLTLPLSKKRIVHFGLAKSTISFFNIINLFFFIPFGFILLKEDYNLWGVISWGLSIGCIILTTNFLNVLLNSQDRLLLVATAILLGLFGLQYYELFDITAFSEPVFMAPYYQPLWLLAPLALMIFSYRQSFEHFLKKLYMDSDEMRPKKEVQRATELKWLDGFGRTSFFLKNDIRLIVRNKRARMAVWMGVAFLFYGLIFMMDIYDYPLTKVFVGIFVTGGFLFSFGQFVPSWDSSYYALMMTQNVPYKEYLKSKWWLVVVGTLVSIPLASFYIFFSWESYFAILAGGIYNIGVNAHMVLLSGAYTRTPIDLNSMQRAFGDKKSFNAKTILLGIPKIFLPMFIFYIGVLVHSKLMGFILIGVVGVLGFALRNLVFDWIEKVYQNEKYQTLAAYKQKNT
ncbi:MAG: DUF5687 family protein [Flavobacteriaceae bacterium]|jgi:hypothetical protein|nr:DUF5687 family protein [Flavobacteriaceae bacterium]